MYSNEAVNITTLMTTFHPKTSSDLIWNVPSGSHCADRQRADQVITQRVLQEFCSIAPVRGGGCCSGRRACCGVCFTRRKWRERAQLSFMLLRACVSRCRLTAVSRHLMLLLCYVLFASNRLCAYRQHTAILTRQRQDNISSSTYY